MCQAKKSLLVFCRQISQLALLLQTSHLVCLFGSEFPCVDLQSHLVASAQYMHVPQCENEDHIFLAVFPL